MVRGYDTSEIQTWIHNRNLWNMDITRFWKDFLWRVGFSIYERMHPFSSQGAIRKLLTLSLCYLLNRLLQIFDYYREIFSIFLGWFSTLQILITQVKCKVLHRCLNSDINTLSFPVLLNTGCIGSSETTLDYPSYQWIWPTMVSREQTTSTDIS